MDRHLQNMPIWVFFVTSVPPYYTYPSICCHIKDRKLKNKCNESFFSIDDTTQIRHQSVILIDSYFNQDCNLWNPWNVRTLVLYNIPFKPERDM